jgi:hypothetical protein
LIEERNAQGLFRISLLLALSLFFASGAPAGLFVASLAWLLFCAALVSSLAATLGGDNLFAAHLTRWDDAAAMIFFSFLAGWAVDPQAVQLALDAATLAGQ